jgi:hypothetical protein
LRVFGAGALPREKAAAAVVAELDADVAVAGGPGFLDVFGGLGGVAAADVVVAGHGVAHLAAEEFVDGHIGALAFDIPEGDVHGGEDVVVDGAVAPVGFQVGALPEVFDLVRVFADEPGLEVLFKGGDDGVGSEGVVGGADAVEAGFGGDDLQEHPAVAGAGEVGMILTSLMVRRGRARRAGTAKRD